MLSPCRRRLALSLLALGSAGALAQPPSRWEATNPGAGGWFERIGVGHAGLLLAASDLSGAYRSTDSGESWDPLGPPQGLMAPHVVGFGFHPTDAQTYFVTTDQGVYRTTDGGDSFDHPQTNGYFGPLALAASQPLIGYAGRHTDFNTADGEIYKTIDGGATWTSVSVDLPPGLRVLRVLIEDGFPDHAYLTSGPGRCDPSPGSPPECGDHGIYRSLDGGVHWTNIGTDFAEPVVDLALDPHQAGTVWAAVDDATAGNHGHLFSSASRGDPGTWLEVANHGGAIWLDPSDPQRIRLFDPRFQFDFPSEDRDGFFVSTDGGTTFEAINPVDGGSWQRGWSNLFWTLTAEPYQVAAHPADPDRLYWSNTQFLYGTTDGGHSVAQIFSDQQGIGGGWRSRGVDNVVIIELEADRGSPGTLWAGFIDLGLWRSTDGGGSWIECNLPAHTGNWEGYGGNTWTIRSDPQRPGTVWAVNSEEEEEPAFLLRTTNGGGPDCDDWSAVGSGLPAAPYLGLAIDSTVLAPGGQRTLYLTADGSVWKSLDDGDSWTQVLADPGMITTAVDPFDPQVVFAGGAGGLMRSDDGGATWANAGVPAMAGAAGGLPFTGWEGVYSIASDPAQSGRRHVAAHGADKGLWSTADDGASWNHVLVDGFAREVVVDPQDPDVLYVSSSSAFDSGFYDPGSSGVWRIEATGTPCGQAGAQCQRLDEGLTWPFVLPLAITADGSVLYAGSPGTGVHVRALRALFADGFESGDVSVWSAATD